MRIDRRSAWIMAGVSILAFTVVALLLVPWDWVPGGELHPAEPLDVFTAGQIARAEEFSGLQRYLGWASYAISLLVAGVLGFTTWGSRLVRRLPGGRHWWLVVPQAVLALLVIGRLVTLPLSAIARQRRLDYGLTTQTWAAWALDVLRSLAVSWVITSFVLLVLLLIVRRSPRRWFVWVGGAAAGLTLVGSFLYPVLLEPIFNDFEPLPDGQLRTAVFDLAKVQGVEIDDVLVTDASRRTTTLNAYVSGFGHTRRVVLYDNLVDGLPLDQARVVVAHELAHAKHNDVLVGTGLGALGAALGVALLALVLDSPPVRRRAGIAGPSDPAAVPLVLALVAVAMLLVSPVQSTISRAIEVRADRDALAATGQSDTFVAMQRELALASLSDPTPPRWSYVWFSTHPTVLERAGLPTSLARVSRGGTQ